MRDKVKYSHRSYWRIFSGCSSSALNCDSCAKIAPEIGLRTRNLVKRAKNGQDICDFFPAIRHYVRLHKRINAWIEAVSDVEVTSIMDELYR